MVVPAIAWAFFEDGLFHHFQCRAGLCLNLGRFKSDETCSDELVVSYLLVVGSPVHLCGMGASGAIQRG